jgi:hypothetical protein
MICSEFLLENRMASYARKNSFKTTLLILTEQRLAAIATLACPQNTSFAASQRHRPIAARTPYSGQTINPEQGEYR